MKIRTINIVFITVFLLIISLSMVDQQLGATSRIFPSSENRSLAELEDIDPSKPSEVVKIFDQYYKDNFGFRNPLYTIYSNFKFHLFKKSPIGEKVIIGKDGWLFLGNKTGNVIEETLGKDTLNNQQLALIAKNVKRNNEWLKRRGIKYYLAIAPNKHTIYKEYLPNYLQKIPKTTKLKQLKKYLNSEINIDLIDLSENLLKRKDDVRLYHKVNTHWNDYGAFIAYQSLLGVVKIDFPSIHIRDIANYRIDTVDLPNNKTSLKLTKFEIL